MADPFVSDLERRAVAHLPRYRAPNETVIVADGKNEREVGYVEHVREVNGYPDDWAPRTSMTLLELLAALTKDAAAVTPSIDQLKDIVSELETKGYVRSAGDAVAMTATGLEALQA